MKKIPKRKPLLLAAISLFAFSITAMSVSCTSGQDADAAANKNTSAVKKGISLNEFFALPSENSEPEELPFSEEKAALLENEGTQSYEGGVFLSQADFSAYEEELVLYTYRYGGWYWVLHQEDNIFYGVYMPIRWFQDLQKNGIHLGSGGSGYTYYHRLHFEDGTFRRELLGRTDRNEGTPCYYIDDEEVGETEFEAWLEELMTGNVQWYNPSSTEASVLNPNTKISKNH